VSRTLLSSTTLPPAVINNLIEANLLAMSASTSNNSTLVAFAAGAATALIAKVLLDRRKEAKSDRVNGTYDVQAIMATTMICGCAGAVVDQVPLVVKMTLKGPSNSSLASW